MKRALGLYDYVRLDHFLGFSAYYAIPAGSTAREGVWLPGPGLDFFEKARAELGPLPLIAEDLGPVTQEVRDLLEQTGIPGMQVVQFDDPGPLDARWRPEPGKLLYASTHDTSTLVGWLESDLGVSARKARTLARKLREKMLASGAAVVMFQLQDVLGLDDAARMNTPGVAEGNWRWQADDLDVGR